MLAYVIIPHQGDFLDSLAMNPVLPTSVGHVAVQEQVLSPFQAVLLGQEVPLTQHPHPHAQASTQFFHPENFLLPEPLPENLHQPSVLSIPPVAITFDQQQNLFVASSPQNFFVPLHVASTVLLI